MADGTIKLLNMLPRWLQSCAWAVLTVSIATCVSANPSPKVPSGQKAITVFTHDGNSLKLGSVTFKPTADGASAAINVELDAPEFGNEFLSMRPFRCLSDTKEMWCHLSYPHGLRRTVTADDLTDLEYELLFIFRPMNSYGIDAWNGLYFELDYNADGTITGPVRETDLNALAVPPVEEFARPIGRGDLEEVSEATHRFSRIEIR